MKALLWTAVLVAGIAAAPMSARLVQDSASASLAAQLVTRLEATKQEAIASAYADDPERFAAALHIPGAQLLVITATYGTPALLREKIMAGEHRQAYLDLYASGVKDDRLFIQDAAANGLFASPRDGGFDITWEEGERQTLFNGDWQSQKLSESDYRERFAEQDKIYAQALRVLLSAVVSPTKGS